MKRALCLSAETEYDLRNGVKDFVADLNNRIASIKYSYDEVMKVHSCIIMYERINEYSQKQNDE